MRTTRVRPPQTSRAKHLDCGLVGTASRLASPHATIRAADVVEVLDDQRVRHRLRLNEQSEVTFMCLHAGATSPGGRDPSRRVRRVDLSADISAVFAAPSVEWHSRMLPR